MVTLGTGVSVGGAIVGSEGVCCWVAVSLSSGVGVGVLVGARVGRGAWVGVATNVLPGRTKVEGVSCVGVGCKVGGITTVPSASGPGIIIGRTKKLTPPKA